MPKFFCENEHCDKHGVLVDIDTSYACYHREFEHPDFILKNKRFYCPLCGLELKLMTRDEDRIFSIGKFASSSWEERKTMLKKRSQDMSIQYNRECRDRKEHFEQKRFKEQK